MNEHPGSAAAATSLCKRAAALRCTGKCAGANIIRGADGPRALGGRADDLVHDLFGRLAPQAVPVGPLDQPAHGHAAPVRRLLRFGVQRHKDLG